MKYHLKIRDLQQWYAILAEARQAFAGEKWSSQNKTRRRFNSHQHRDAGHVVVWFDVPDPVWVTMIILKYGVELEE